MDSAGHLGGGRPSADRLLTNPTIHAHNTQMLPPPFTLHPQPAAPRAANQADGAILLLLLDLLLLNLIVSPDSGQGQRRQRPRGLCCSARHLWDGGRAPPRKKAAHGKGVGSSGHGHGHGHHHGLTAAAAAALRRADGQQHRYNPCAAHAHAQTVEAGLGASGSGSVGRLFMGLPHGGAATASLFGANPNPGSLLAAATSSVAAAAAPAAAAAATSAPAHEGLFVYPGNSRSSVASSSSSSAGGGGSGGGLGASLLLKSQLPPERGAPSTSVRSSASTSTSASTNTATRLPAVLGATLGGRPVGLHPSYILAFISHLSAGRVNLDRARAIL